MVTPPAEVRYLVIPRRPAGTDGWSEEQLAELVTRDSMIGVGLPRRPVLARGGGDTGAMSDHDGGYVTNADLGGTTGHGPIVPEQEGTVFHHGWEGQGARAHAGRRRTRTMEHST